MTLPILCIAAGMVLLCIFLPKRAYHNTAKIAVLKSVISACFMGTALTSVIACIQRQGDAVFGLIILCGLFFGALGDIWLDLKYVNPESEKVYTYTGFVVFAIGHVFYDCALIYRYYVPGNLRLLIISLIIPVIIGFATPLTQYILNVRYGDMKVITCIYTAFLSSLFFVTQSLAIMNHFESITLNMIFAASALFIISDGLLSKTYFGHDRTVYKVVNHITYYFAQFLIAFSIFFCGWSGVK